MIALRSMVAEAYRKVSMELLILGYFNSSLLSLFIKLCSLGNFFTLCFSTIIYFGVYAVIMTLLKEPLVLEIEGQVWSMLKNKLKGN